MCKTGHRVHLSPSGAEKTALYKGKPLWTAPEAIEGSRTDRRADLYALGLLFWNLLSGQTTEAINLVAESLSKEAGQDTEAEVFPEGFVAIAARRSVLSVPRQQ